MAAAAPKTKLLVIVGPTASGKSELAMRVAKRFNGEIIAADSLTAYKGMDIGTAKPTRSEQKQIKHWGLDLVGPGQRFTAADFKSYAQDKITDIQKRGRLPILVGGTGLYVDSLILNFSFGAEANKNLRQKLEKLSTQKLQSLVRSKAYPMPTNSQNRRHLIRTIERQGETGGKLKKPPSDVLIVGLMPGPETLRSRINKRVEAMFNVGLVPETKRLLKRYGREGLIAKAKVAYGPVIEYLARDYDLAAAKDRLKTAHWQYARRQKTWFKRNRFINWFSDPKTAYDFIVKSI